MCWEKSEKLPMARRVTIMIDDDLDKKIRYKQAKLIEKRKESVSFSRVVNDSIRECFKNGK
jgi:hypothetical protein